MQIKQHFLGVYVKMGGSKYGQAGGNNPTCVKAGGSGHYLHGTTVLIHELSLGSLTAYLRHF